MNRMEEYETLLSAPLPDALEHTVDRAMVRCRRQRRLRRSISAAAGTLAGAAALFVLLVNISLPFAQACGKIPFLRELAQAVAFSPTLSAAVENEYVQPVDQTRNANGATMTVRYLIADRRQLTIFYTLTSDDPDTLLECRPHLEGADGTALPSHAMAYSNQWETGEELRTITATLTEGTVPEDLILTADIYRSPWSDQATAEAQAPDSALGEEETESEPELLTSFTFSLHVNASQIVPEQVWEIGRTLTLDGQTITVEKLEVYPTFAQLTLSDHLDNTAWLTNLSFYLTDELGNRYEPGSASGISAFGSDTPFTPTYLADSGYFSGAREYTLHITGARWLDKGMERVNLDFDDHTMTPMPDIMADWTAERQGSDVILTFTSEASPMAPFSTRYWDSAGNEHDTGGYSALASPEDSYSIQELLLKDCLDSQVTLSLQYSRITAYPDEVTLALY